MEAGQKILIAVNDSESAMRAVRYVGEMIGCKAGLDLCILHIYPPPPPFFYQEGGNLDTYRKEQEEISQKIFTKAANILEEYGIPVSSVATRCQLATGGTISQTILDVREAGDYGTVVVGRRGVSKAEEFLFGSISSAMVHRCDHFAVWVVR